MRYLLALILIFPVLAQESKPSAAAAQPDKPAASAQSAQPDRAAPPSEQNAQAVPATAAAEPPPNGAQAAPPQTTPPEQQTQQQAPPAKPDQTAPQKPEEKPAAPPDQTAAQSPAPTAEQWLTGSMDFGYRYIPDIKGNFQEYRSVVDLGEGPKLFGVDFAIQDPKKRLFDRIEAQGYGWGDDPYTTARINARKMGVYDFNFDYRNIALFDAVPSFANPNTPAGFNEQSFDTRRRLASFNLDIFPGKRIIPYLAYEHNSGQGRGIWTWVQSASDEFAVPSLFADSTDNYRGGVRFEFNRFHVTLEQGGTTFRDDDQASWNGTNFGDNAASFLGRNQTLTGLQQNYHVRGTSIYEKGLLTARPASWIDIYGQFLFSQPKTDAHYTDLAYGQFTNVAALLLYSGQSDIANGLANQPHTTANIGFELRPFGRLRIVESLLTDRFHDAESSVVAQQILFGGATPGQNVNTALSYGQFVNYNQQQLDVLFDLTSKLTLRGGFRYLWGDASILAGELSQTGNLVAGELRRSVGLAGLTYRAFQKLTVNLDYEGSSSDRIYFRTSLNDYSRGRARVKYQATNSLMFQANFQVLDNQNPASDIRYDFRSRSNSFSVYWTPAGAKRFSILGEYDRSTLRSDISYLGLFFAPAVSSYRDNAHTATSAIDLTLPGLPGAKLTAGGSLFISHGSRPTRLYEPVARVSVPIGKHVYWFGEWQYYGFGEDFYMFEGFRANILQLGFRLTQ